MSDFKKKFGANLKGLRKSRNITQEKLSELVDIHHRQMSKIETGDHFPSCKTLEKLCFALKVVPTRLFNFDFTYDDELFMTGTDNIPCYKAIKRGNVITLQNYRNQEITTAEESFIPSLHERMSNLARRINKTVTVEHFEDGEILKTITFTPDGAEEIIDKQNEIPTKNVDMLVNLFKSVSEYEGYIDFVKLAIQSIEDNNALERLEATINGMKLARKFSLKA